MITCEKCGAECKPGRENRFNKRHPKACVRFETFHAALANGTASVDYDEDQRVLDFKANTWRLLDFKEESHGNDQD